jgi:acetyl-CoA acetyltransferase
MCPVALGHAAMAVQHGLADYVVCVHALNSRSNRIHYGGGEALGDTYDAVWGMTSPGAYYALAFTRYLEQYGGSEEQLGAISVAFRKHASMNPKATMQSPITREDYRNARYLAKPLRLFDYCLVNDGAVAYIVTSAERARDLKHRPVYISSFTERITMREYYVDEDLWYGVCQGMAKDLFEPAGVTTKDIDVIQMYDNFSLSALWGLEGFGFAPRGEGLDWIQGGRIELGGEVPMNTSGGMLSEAYLQGWNGHAEAVRQLRGEAGPRQVADAEWSLYWCLSAVPGGSLLHRG